MKIAAYELVEKLGNEGNGACRESISTSERVCWRRKKASVFGMHGGKARETKFELKAHT